MSVHAKSLQLAALYDRLPPNSGFPTHHLFLIKCSHADLVALSVHAQLPLEQLLLLRSLATDCAHLFYWYDSDSFAEIHSMLITSSRDYLLWLSKTVQIPLKQLILLQK